VREDQWGIRVREVTTACLWAAGPEPDERGACGRTEKNWMGFIGDLWKAGGSGVGRGSHNMMFITDLERAGGAGARGWRKPWLYDLRSRWRIAPACGEKIRPGVAVCPDVRGDFGSGEKAAKFGVGRKGRRGKSGEVGEGGRQEKATREKIRKGAEERPALKKSTCNLGVPEEQV